MHLPILFSILTLFLFSLETLIATSAPLKAISMHDHHIQNFTTNPSLSTPQNIILTIVPGTPTAKQRQSHYWCNWCPWHHSCHYRRYNTNTDNNSSSNSSNDTVHASSRTDLRTALHTDPPHIHTSKTALAKFAKRNHDGFVATMKYLGGLLFLCGVKGQWREDRYYCTEERLKADDGGDGGYW